MASWSFHSIAIFLFILAIVIMFGNAKSLDVAFKETACNGRTVAPAGDYFRAVGYALDNAVTQTALSSYNYYGSGRYMHATAYTHGQCNGDLDKEDCKRCEEIAKGYLIQSCGFHTEGWVELVDCFISWWEFPNR